MSIQKRLIGRALAVFIAASIAGPALCFQVDYDASDRVQELHQLAYHLICDRIERSIT